MQLSNVQCESGARIAIHTVQLLPEKSFRVCENNEVLTLQHGGHAQLVLDVAVCTTTAYIPHTKVDTPLIYEVYVTNVNLAVLEC